MDFDKLYKQTYNFEKRTLQLDEPVDGFSDNELQGLEEKLKSVSREIKKKYSNG